MATLTEQQYLDYAYQMHRSMSDAGTILVYEGEINQALTKLFASMAEGNMTQQEENFSVSKKVYHVMIECLQNIVKHSDKPQKAENLSNSEGLFIVGKNDDYYVVTTGNYISSNKKNVIEETLKQLNELDPEAIKALYKLKLKESRLSEKGGAGLGFVDMAKKTGEKIGYKFIEVDSETVYFMVSFKISRKKGLEE
jgi:hypothetical protein